MKPFIPCECYVHGEFGVLPMFVSLVLVFPPSKVCIATLREGGGGAALFCPLQAAICSVWRALWLVCRLLDPTNSEPREIVTAAAVGRHGSNWRLHLKVAVYTFQLGRGSRSAFQGRSRAPTAYPTLGDRSYRPNSRKKNPICTYEIFLLVIDAPSARLCHAWAADDHYSSPPAPSESKFACVLA